MCDTQRNSLQTERLKLDRNPPGKYYHVALGQKYRSLRNRRSDFEVRCFLLLRVCLRVEVEKFRPRQQQTLTFGSKNGYINLHDSPIRGQFLTTCSFHNFLTQEYELSNHFQNSKVKTYFHRYHAISLHFPHDRTRLHSCLCGTSTRVLRAYSSDAPPMLNRSPALV